MISELKTKKSTGHDGIKAKTLKEIKEEIAEPITYLVNTCFEKGSFPDILKLGIVKPVYKSGDKSQMSNYEKLLEKMFYGFRGSIYDLVSSYLTNREQVVMINDKYSERREITYGIPQGTVLGPLLFLIYINSLLEMESEGQLDLQNTVSRDFEQKIKMGPANDLFNQKTAGYII